MLSSLSRTPAQYCFSACLVFLALFSFAYFGTLELMVGQWIESEASIFSSGLLVTTCTVYLLYLRKDLLKEISPEPNIYAVIPLAIFVLLWFVGKR